MPAARRLMTLSGQAMDLRSIISPAGPIICHVRVPWGRDVPVPPRRSPLRLVGKRWRAFRRLAKPARLLEGVGQGEEFGLGVVEAQQLGTDRHTERRGCGGGGEPARKGD